MVRNGGFSVIKRLPRFEPVMSSWRCFAGGFSDVLPLTNTWEIGCKLHVWQSVISLNLAANEQPQICFRSWKKNLAARRASPSDWFAGWLADKLTSRVSEWLTDWVADKAQVGHWNSIAYRSCSLHFEPLHRTNLNLAMAWSLHANQESRVDFSLPRLRQFFMIPRSMHLVINRLALCGRIQLLLEIARLDKHANTNAKKAPRKCNPAATPKALARENCKNFFFLAFLFACFSHALVASFPAFFPSFLQVVDFLE